MQTAALKIIFSFNEGRKIDLYIGGNSEKKTTKTPYN